MFGTRNIDILAEFSDLKCSYSELPISRVDSGNCGKDEYTGKPQHFGKFRAKFFVQSIEVPKL